MKNKTPNTPVGLRAHLAGVPTTEKLNRDKSSTPPLKSAETYLSQARFLSENQKFGTWNKDRMRKV